MDCEGRTIVDDSVLIAEILELGIRWSSLNVQVQVFRAGLLKVNDMKLLKVVTSSEVRQPRQLQMARPVTA